MPTKTPESIEWKIASSADWKPPSQISQTWLANAKKRIDNDAEVAGVVGEDNQGEFKCGGLDFGSILRLRHDISCGGEIRQGMGWH